VRLQLLLAIGVPAAVAAAVSILALPEEDGGRLVILPAGERGDPRLLARAADLPRDPRGVKSLRPIVVRGGRARLGRGVARVDAGRGRPAPPARISIPAAGVEASIEPVRLDGEELEVPAVGRAGWFDAGPRPGEQGRAVVVGHLDGRDGPGLFARLPAVAPGTGVSIADTTGRVHPYRVVGKAQVPKARFPKDSVYGSSDRPVLVLVTCGGPWRRGAGYRDNILVYARMEI
jgi:hypothetical protein